MAERSDDRALVALILCPLFFYFKKVKTEGTTLINSDDRAYELEKALRESDEYRALKKAYETVNQDFQAKQMFEKFRRIQLDLQKKTSNGRANQR